MSKSAGSFEKTLPTPFFNSETREAVLKAMEFGWGAVSPAIFGSMFQFVMDVDDKDKRHDIGAHYTSERNIRKVISGLFLDDLRAKFKAAGDNAHKLNDLWDELAQISLLDPRANAALLQSPIASSAG